MEKLIKARHLKRYIKEVDHREESRQTLDRVMAGAAIPTYSRPAINYILGGPFDDQYQLKCQHKNILRVATVNARINTIHTEGSHEETKPINGPISFPPINLNRIIVSYYEALVLTLYINGFYVHRVLVNPGSAADFLQLPASSK